MAIILALLWLGFPRNGVVEALTALVGLVLFLVPWLLGESGLALDGWTSCIIGNVLVVGAGWLLSIRIAVLGRAW